jgi:hypothetical protein
MSRHQRPGVFLSGQVAKLRMLKASFSAFDPNRTLTRMIGCKVPVIPAD